jgi:hypothetical protein
MTYQKKRLVVPTGERTMDPEHKILTEHVAVKLAQGDVTLEDARRINAGEGWTYDVGDGRNWTRYEGAKLSEANLAEAERLSRELILQGVDDPKMLYW